MKLKIIFLSVVIACVAYSCYKEEEYDEKEISTDRLIELINIDKVSLLANDDDTAVVTVQLPLKLKDAYNLVKVKTTHGVFTETGKTEAEAAAKIVFVNGEQRKLVTFHLRSGLSTGTGTVEFSINNVSTQRTITFTENPPTSIRIVPTALYMPGGPAGEFSFKTTLGSGKGKVTAGQVVQVSLKDDNNHDKGTMRVSQLKSNAAGENNFIYSIIPDTSFVGGLTIRAQCLGLKDSLKILVVK